MKLSELIERLTEVQAEVGDVDPEVQLATQAHYPLRYHLRGVELGRASCRERVSECV